LLELRLMGVPMKNLLQDLLIVFALGLCVLLAFQLHRERVLRDQFHNAEASVRSEKEKADSLQNDVRRLQGEIDRLDVLRKRLAVSGAVSDEEVARILLQLLQHDKLAAELESVKAALARAKENIETQTESLTELAEERNDVADRFNELAEEYNSLASRWNDLLLASTNRPAPALAPAPVPPPTSESETETESEED
jgi:chromosome segregation ATPase